MVDLNLEKSTPVKVLAVDEARNCTYLWDQSSNRLLRIFLNDSALNGTYVSLSGRQGKYFFSVDGNT